MSIGYTLSSLFLVPAFRTDANAWHLAEIVGEGFDVKYLMWSFVNYLV